MYSYIAVISGHTKSFTILPNKHPFTHRQSATQGDSQRVVSSQGGGALLRDTSTFDTARSSRGIKLETFRLTANPLYLLSHMPPPKKLHKRLK